MFSYPQNKTIALVIFEFDILTQNNVTMIAIFKMFTNSKFVFRIKDRSMYMYFVLEKKMYCVV